MLWRLVAHRSAHEQPANVLLLADMVGDDAIAMRLRQPHANQNTIVALSLEDHKRLLEAPKDPPVALASLRAGLASRFAPSLQS
jgi:hypothetical protein